MSLAYESGPTTIRRAAPPMLARNAESMFWMSRYTERAEHVSRLLWVNSLLVIDVGDLADIMKRLLWRGVLETMQATLPDGVALTPTSVMEALTFGENCAPSLLNCLTRARENARGIREKISTEMWECMNRLYWFIRSKEARDRFTESPEQVWLEVMNGSMLFQGLTDHTIPHDQRWHFAQTGKYLERIDITCRIIGTQHSLLQAAEYPPETSVRNVHWMGVLRSCCSMEPYRQRKVGDLDPTDIAAYLLLESDYPRSVLFAVSQANRCVTAIAADVGGSAAVDAQRFLGRLEAQLRYAQSSDLHAQELGTYLQSIQRQIVEAASSVHRAYFL